ncbi:hypothetical protein HDV05_003089 [Chytridiales sp. JEL 0842]|nr:hypothetical protein HDV05_003089 [Chytridiales sp. JEL 0842]
MGDTDIKVFSNCIPADVIPTEKTLIKLAEGVNVPPVGIGIWSWGSKEWGYGAEVRGEGTAFNEDSIRAAFNTSQDILNVTCFWDTAEVYSNGESERILGKLVAERRASHPDAPEERIHVASKFLPMPYKLAYPSSLMTSLKASLERCGLKSFALYQIHGPVHLRSIEVVADALAVAYKEGLVKSVGVSNYSISEMTRMHAALKKHGIQLASNQVEFSLLRRLPETSGLIKAAHDLGVAILAYSPLAMGKLTGKYSSANPPDNFRNNFGKAANMEQIGKLMDTLNDVAKKYEKSPSQIALNWIICKGAIPIPGAKNARQAESNAKCIGWRLSEEDVKLLDSVSFEGSNTMIWQHG